MNTLKKAKTYYKEAVKEFKLAKNVKDGVKLQDACAKAWLAVVEATNTLFLKNNVSVDNLPKGFRGQNYFLIKYASKDIRKMFYSLRNIFHIEGYYEGSLNFDDIPDYLNDVKEYIKMIEKIDSKKVLKDIGKSK